MTTEDKMEQLLDIIDDIANNGFDESSSKEKIWQNKLIEIYSDNDFRHSYAELSKKIENFDSLQRDFIVDTLDNILLEVDLEFQHSDIIKKIVKLCDHMELESIRLNRMDNIKFIGENVSELQRQSENDLKNNASNINQLTEKINRINSQIITVLGIFAGLVITFATMSQVSTSIISELTKDNLYSILLVFLIIGCVIYNTIFMMMYVVSKIAGVSIAVLCRDKRCDSCAVGHCAIKRLSRKYPYVFWINILFVIIIAILLFLILRTVN